MQILEQCQGEILCEGRNVSIFLSFCRLAPSLLLSFLMSCNNEESVGSSVSPWEAETAADIVR